MTVLYFIAVFFTIISGTYLFSRATGKAFGYCLPMYFILISYMLYISQFLTGSFAVGYAFSLVCAMIGVFLFIFLFFEKRSGTPLAEVNDYGFSTEETGLKISAEKFMSVKFSPGLISFVAIFIVFACLDFSRHFSDFDEFWHWGMMVKEMYRLDSFYCVDASHQIIHKDYPPFLALIELWFCHFTDGYRESTVTFALHCFEFSLLIPPLCEKLFSKTKESRTQRNWKILISAMILTLSFACLLLCFDTVGMFHTILADFPIAILFAAAMIQIITEDATKDFWGYIFFLLTLCALLMTKQIGVAHLLVIVFSFFLWNMKNGKAKAFLQSVIALFAPFVLSLPWKILINSLNISDFGSSFGGSGQFDLSKISISTYLNAVTGRSNDLLNSTFRNYIKALLGTKITGAIWPNLTYVTAFILVLLLLWLLYRRHEERLSKKNARYLGFSFIVGSAGFAFMFSVMFLFFFTEDEMAELRGYARYMDSYVAGEFLVLFILFLLYVKPDFLRIRNLMILCALLVIFPFGKNLSQLKPQVFAGTPTASEESISDTIRDVTDEDSTIIVFYDSQIHDVDWKFAAYLTYYLNDRSVSVIDISSTDFSSEDAMYLHVLGLDASNYIYILETNDASSSWLEEYLGQSVEAGNCISLKQ